MSLLKTIDLYYTFDNSTHQVLKNINLEITPGVFTSIVGPSGSGKTTLLRMLAGNLTPDAGQVLFRNEPMEGPEIRLVPGYDEIKLVFQQYELRPNISAKENINAALLGYQKAYREERVNYLLDFFFMSEFAHFKPGELSGGQQQRLAIAKAMANEPEVLLMDEPFSALDPTKSALFLQEMKKLASDTGTAVVLVTHDTRDAMVADEVIVLMDGTVKQKGSPEEVYHHPKELAIASFFGPLNEIPQGLWEEMSADTSRYIRPEDLEIRSNGEGADYKVRNVIFRGAYHVLQVQSKKGLVLIAYDFERKLQIGDRVWIKPNTSKIMAW